LYYVGTCVRLCPQSGESFRNDLEEAKLIVKENPIVAASIAPSFAAVFSDWQVNSFASALRKMGFTYIAVTAVGAYYISQNQAKLSKPIGQESFFHGLSVFVRYVELYQPKRLKISCRWFRR
jgi:iron only hydrogenase large subunit-like protein